MRNLLLLCALLCSIFAFAQQKKSDNSFIRSLPVPHRAVNDFGKFLSIDEKQRLEKELTTYQKRVTNAIAIVVITLDSLTDPITNKQYTVEETALQYFNTWGIGDRTGNNGVLLLVSRNPRRVRIEVGRGLDAILTNSVCQRIVDDSLVPNFKKGFYFAGLKGAAAAIVQKVDSPQKLYQESSVPPQTSTPEQNQSYAEYEIRSHESPLMGAGIFLVGFFLFIVILVISLVRAMARRKGGWYTRSGYNNGHYNNGLRRNSLLFINSNNAVRSSNDDASSFSSVESSSGSWSSDISSSSSDSFSGGSSDGGGASGSW